MCAQAQWNINNNKRKQLFSNIEPETFSSIVNNLQCIKTVAPNLEQHTLYTKKYIYK